MVPAQKAAIPASFKPSAAPPTRAAQIDPASAFRQSAELPVTERPNPYHLRALQRAAGNRAVNHMLAQGAIQAKQHVVQEVKPTGPAKEVSLQRKIMIGKNEYSKKEQDSEQIATAISDEFIRYYANEGQMRGHLETNTPSSFGLIKKRALWYDIPYLPDEFFVLGESHAGVKGPDIKEASNIQKPILYEGYAGWNVEDHSQDYGDEGGDHGVDENSSKLLRALEVWNPAGLLGGAVAPSASTEKIPKIPSGQKSTRKEDDGSYRLVIRGDDYKEKWWTPKGQHEAPTNDYDQNQEALNAVTGLFKVVFKDEIEEMELDKYGDAFEKAWPLLNNGGWKKYPDNLQPKVLANIRIYLYEGVLKKVKEGYDKLKKTTGALIKHADDSTLKDADSYRDEFILASIVKASKTDKFAFAAIGNRHLGNLKERLGTEGVKSISMEDFYGKYSKDAVDIPDRPIWDFSTIEHLNLSNLITNQTRVILEAVEEGRMPRLKKLTIREESMTPDLHGRFKAQGIAVELT